MKELLERARAQFEENEEIILDIPTALVEIGKLKSLGGNFQSILTTLFSPFLRKTLEFNQKVNSCNYHKFIHRFKLYSGILHPLNSLVEADIRFILAGGKMIDFCNNVPIGSSLGDYDLFFTDEDSYNLAVIVLTRIGYEALSEKNHVSELFNTQLGIKVQLIKKMYSCPEEVLESFDIRACAVAYADGKIWWVDGSLRDIKDKKVVIQNIRPYKLAWLRPLKYYSRGYTIAPPDLALISISYLLSMDEKDKIDSFPYFVDRTYQYVSAPGESPYDGVEETGDIGEVL